MLIRQGRRNQPYVGRDLARVTDLTIQYDRDNNYEIHAEQLTRAWAIGLPLHCNSIAPYGSINLVHQTQLVLIVGRRYAKGAR